METIQELKIKKIWICWNRVFKNGKRTKMPYSSKGGPSGTDAKYSSTWVTFDEAAVAAKTHGFAGVGFVIPEGYFFLDIDDRDLSDAFVQTLLERFDSYSEHSVSGKGIHIYGTCDLSKLPTFTDEKGRRKLDQAYYMKNSSNSLELYIGGITNRYAVFTGKAIEYKPLRDCTDAVLTTLDQDMIRKAKVSDSKKGDSGLQVLDIIASLRSQKNGEKFAKLFDEGDISEYDDDDSRADAALCSLIAFRTGDDPELIDAVFRRSALCRDKWNSRADYRDMTIRAAVAACGESFHHSVMSKPPFIGYDAKGKEYIVCPLLSRHIRENLHYLFVSDSRGRGVRRFVYRDGCYRLHSEEMLKGIIKSYITDYDERLLKMKDVNEVYLQLTTDLQFVRQEELDADEDLINFRNGLLRLSDLTLLPHSPDVYSTIQIPCNWTGKEKPTPEYDRFLKTLTNGDQEVESLLYEFKGVCISCVKGPRMKKSLFLIGPGDTGKSIEKKLVESLLGYENCVAIDLRDLEKRFGTSNLYGKRLAGSSDMSFMSINELRVFKICTGGDSLFAEFKGTDGFDFTYNGLLFFCMNKLPKFGGDDGQWVFDRIIVIECPNVIPLEEQDKQLLDKLKAELEGIAYKSVMALKNVIANGYRFTEPESVKKARMEYMATNSTVISFYDECMVMRSGNITTDGCTASRIYEAYRAWCRANNNGYAKPYKDFCNELAAHRGTCFDEMTVRRSTGRYYKDFTLSAEAKELYGCIGTFV